MTTERTVQLRRYSINPGELPAFIDWWRGRLLPAREAFGYRLEFAYAVPESDEFVWAVSVAGDAEALAALDAAWAASPERAAAFEGEPKHTAGMELRIATPVA